jgi:transposase-like protein
VTKKINSHPRYSAEFKASIVALFKSGARSVFQLQHEYQIHGNMTIYNWIAQSESNDTLVQKLEPAPVMKKPLKVSTENLTEAQLNVLLKAQLKATEDLLAQERLRSETYLTALNMLSDDKSGSSKKKSGTKPPKP